MMETATVLVTGATGFIGRAAAAALARRGWNVIALTARSPIELGPNVKWRLVDLEDQGAAAKLAQELRPTHLLHAAWARTRPGGLWDADDNWLWRDVSLDMLRAFWAAGGRHAVVCGSCAEYESAATPCEEFSTPVRPGSLYGRAKVALHEEAASEAARLGGGLSWARIFFAYGPNEHPSRLAPSIIDQLLKGETAPCSEGRQVRDYAFIGDIGAGLAALVKAEISGPFNVGSGRGVEIRELVRRIGEKLGAEALIRFGALPSRQVEFPYIVADIARIGRLADWRPSTTLDDGLSALIDWRRRVLAGEES